MLNLCMAIRSMKRNRSCLGMKCRATSSITPRQVKAGESSMTTPGTDQRAPSALARRYTPAGNSWSSDWHP